ncbi:hypothetical protein ASD00_35990 [Ensifer sp. Root31]|uniref:hypothetical protein n=1 Tax=Ensifer sp. Root31 TaxID=1736512 RepID=UPI00070CC7B2|nr:hypothetical protein [Ensifer sp. Root31]KQU79814.1 hypothetical protein ASD00_35990 [Ensifer sp. Root31]
MATLYELPALFFDDCEFDPVQPRNIDQMEGRRTEGQTFGTPFWRANYKFSFLKRLQLGVVDGWIMDVQSSASFFIGYDIARPRPMLHDTGKPLSGVKAGGGAFVGDAVLQSVANPSTIVVSGLPAGFALSIGDYVEIRKSTYVRSLHRIRSPAVANGAGVVTLSIRFHLDTQNFALPCTVHFEKPGCIMQVDAGTWSSSKAMGARTPTFSATEVFPNA